ncbi:hypothetical protein KUTeg_022523 [Tegillarca granosa]|uniref:RBPJ-interacting and tubulin-associated protein 1 n=1 Tax=Tegillarca granosa TaxID=220873 RepID=A0ABQ9E9A0_TEGGR|nr:hypothetical protein KUTeg_022523 [Tegillarca granosa]
MATPGRGTLDQFPLPRTSDKSKHRHGQGRLVRLATVSLSARSKPSSRGQIASLYYEEPGNQKKVIGWDEANNHRPPLRIDMEGPGPWSYSPRNKPLYETNSPSWTFGSKTQPDKEGGARTSWEKSWFQTANVWQQKVDFYSETSWPAPSTYKQKPLLGPKQRTFTEAPSFSIGVRKDFLIGKPGADKEPSSADYDSSNADKQLFSRGPSFSHQFRREGTVLWGNSERTPGPAAYFPRVQTSKPSGPNFSIRGLRREKSHVLGPFSTF